jgi:poly(ADP-ribose) glycohydrolase ARH3
MDSNGMREAGGPLAVSLRSKFAGALLGGMVGDTFGAPVENWACERVNEALDLVARLPARSAYRSLYDDVLGPLSARPGPARFHYTDDTQMTIAVAESLLARARFDGQDIADRLVLSFDTRRSYGSSVYSILQGLKRGVSWEEAGRHRGGEGSPENGGAARVTPLALLYHDAEKGCLQLVAEVSSAITHAHPLGREGAALQAAAIALAVRCDPRVSLHPIEFLGEVASSVCLRTSAFTEALRQIASLLECRPGPREVAAALGNGCEAHRSVPAALYAFLAHRDSFEDAVRFAVRLGGDTDTIAALCGALVGAYAGDAAIPDAWLNVVENDEKGRDYVSQLANSLYALWLRHEQPYLSIK